jgi:putative N6-adenine-specific DNA methylase
MSPPLVLPTYAVVAPGLEEVAAAELTRLGASVEEREAGGLAFRAGPELLADVNVGARTVSRILVRLAEFPVRALGELERRARQVPWERMVAPGTPVRFRVTCRKSRLYHTGAVAQRLAEGLLHRVPGAVLAGGDVVDAEEGGDDAQLFVVRVIHDRCLISADSSGAHLHQRGYRLAVAKAPLRETLAAALLLAAEWDPRAPLLDPFCGSGTIPIEGALLARRIAPGLLGRTYAAERWPELAGSAWEGARARAREAVLPAAPAPILASDRDEGAVAATIANAERAGVAGDVVVAHRPFSALVGPAGSGWLVSNPPYGARIGDATELRDLFARLGQVARNRLGGWRLAILAADSRLVGQTRLPLEERLRTTNGGIPVRLMVGRVPSSVPRGA